MLSSSAVIGEQLVDNLLLAIHRMGILSRSHNGPTDIVAHRREHRLETLGFAQLADDFLIFGCTHRVISC
jgi:hypothetical protein